MTERPVPKAYANGVCCVCNALLGVEALHDAWMRGRTESYASIGFTYLEVIAKYGSRVCEKHASDGRREIVLRLMDEREEIRAETRKDRGRVEQPEDALCADSLVEELEALVKQARAQPLLTVAEVKRAVNEFVARGGLDCATCSHPMLVHTEQGCSYEVREWEGCEHNFCECTRFIAPDMRAAKESDA